MNKRFDVRESYTGKFIVWDKQKKNHIGEFQRKRHADIFAETMNGME